MVAIPSFWNERKLLVFLALIILASAAALFELHAARSGQQTPVDEVVGAIFTPLQGALTRALDAAAGEARALARAGGLAAENEALRKKVAQLASADERLKSKAIENNELRALLAMRQGLGRPAIEAEVVGYAPESLRREITIDRGWKNGVRRNAVVVGSSGLVGHVIDAGPAEAHVLLITDPSSAVPAHLDRTRTWGIVTGTFLHAKMKYISQDVKVLVGDPVSTGQGEVYPGGVPIGRVSVVERKDNALYQIAVLDPAIDFSSLRHVLVLKSQ